MLLGALITALWMGIASDARAQERLTVLLDWFVNPDHGPLIVAQEKGYFAEAGLEVDLADGSVRIISNTLDAETLKNLIQPADGNFVGEF